MTYLTHLECSQCHRQFNAQEVHTFCPDCTAPLLARYDLKKARSELDREYIRCSPRGIWRWKELLPVCEPSNIISLGEGDTPLLHLPRLGEQLALPHLYVKDESLNPTGTFKARGLSTAVSKAREFGLNRVIIPTAGNAGGAMAAYAARGGLQACILMPVDTPRANLEECRITGAQVILVDGLISDAARQATEKVKSEDWFDLSTFKEPYRVEGKKVMGYELAEALDWRLPDVIIYPTGGGTGLVGMQKAFSELDDMGWLENVGKPRLIAVQAEGCAPVVKAFNNSTPVCEYWENAQTLASGLRVPRSFADRIILQDIRASGGYAIAVSDEQILGAQRQLAITEGIFAAPEGAATLAGLAKLLEKGLIHPGEKIVLFNTGSGLKYI